MTVPNFGSMTMTLHAKRYLYDPKKIKLWQSIEIHEKLGFKFAEWEHAVMNSDPKALAALYWVIMWQGGEEPALEDILADRDIDLGEFFTEYTAAFIVWKAGVDKKLAEEAGRAAPKAGGGSVKPTGRTRRQTPTSAG